MNYLPSQGEEEKKPAISGRALNRMAIVYWLILMASLTIGMVTTNSHPGLSAIFFYIALGLLTVALFAIIAVIIYVVGW